MNRSKVIIVKMKWDEDSHYSKVKRVFFEEKNAIAFIDENKKKEKYKGAWWVWSDREISDYTPCMNERDVKIIKIEAQQSLISSLIDERKSHQQPDIIDINELESKWAELEKLLIDLKE